MISTPDAAAICVACPDGYAQPLTWSTMSGRGRCMRAFPATHDTAATRVTAAIQAAVLRSRRAANTTATTSITVWMICARVISAMTSRKSSQPVPRTASVAASTTSASNDISGSKDTATSTVNTTRGAAISAAIAAARRSAWESVTALLGTGASWGGPTKRNRASRTRPRVVAQYAVRGGLGVSRDARAPRPRQCSERRVATAPSARNPSAGQEEVRQTRSRCGAPARYAGRVIDLRTLREDPEAARDAQRRRGASPDLVDEILADDEARRQSIAAFEKLRAEQKAMGKQVAQAQGDEKAALLAQTKELSVSRSRRPKPRRAKAEEAFDAAMARLPNLASPEAPAGGEDDYTVLEHVGEPRDFKAEGFEPLDHVELGKRLGAIDIERGAKVSGARFYYLTGVGADARARAGQHGDGAGAQAAGFTPMIPPALVKPRAMEGTGFLGQAAADVYHLPDDDFYLVGTSEVPLAAYHIDEILDAETLPRRYAAFSPCYRKEAGSYGKDTRGIFRVHWFDKVEMFTYTTLEESFKPSTSGCSTGRRSGSTSWSCPTESSTPRPATSASRRTQVRLRGVDPDPGQVPRAHLDVELHGVPGAAAQHPRPLRRRHQAVATLNGTLVRDDAHHRRDPRDHQQADGSVRVPEALQPYLQGRTTLDPIA